MTSVTRQFSGPAGLPIRPYSPGIIDSGSLAGAPSLISAMYWLMPSV
jgi:hypothetical protein